MSGEENPKTRRITIDLSEYDVESLEKHLQRFEEVEKEGNINEDFIKIDFDALKKALRETIAYKKNKINNKTN